MMKHLCMLVVAMVIAAVNSKPGYKIKLVKQKGCVFETDVPYCEPLLTSFNISAIDESTNALFASLTIIKDLPEDVKIIIRVSKETNEGRMVEYLKVETEYCSYVEKNAAIIQNVFRVANFTDCPPKAGTYAISGMTIDETGFPDDLAIPSSYSVDVELSTFYGGPSIFQLSMLYDVVPATGN